MLLNNKKQAIQRLMRLKRRFIKDNNFFQDYLKFMDNLLKSGYAKRPDSSPSRKTKKTISLTIGCITPVNQVKSVLCLIAVQIGIAKSAVL